MKDYPQDEEKILEFWQKNNIFAKSVKKRSSKKPFVFYEGPPTANGHPGIHHVLARCFKDLICRFKSMQGYRVERRAGWDTHGLPVELEVEKELGISGKSQIESLKDSPQKSIKYFNKLCQKSVWQYKDEWEQLTKRIGFWIDLDHPYVTYTKKYIKGVWQVLKKIWQENFLYEDFKVVPYCPRCGTSLSSHELAQGYKKVEEQSVYVKFKIKPPLSLPLSKGEKQRGSTYLLAWTTTPWTLPGNTALAINESIKYAVCSIQGEKDYYILAKDRVKEVFANKDYEIAKEVSGKEITGLKYEPLYNIKGIVNHKKSLQVYTAGFVGAQEGTGIVHAAVMYGIEDYEFGEEVGLPKVHTVDEEGRFKISASSQDDLLKEIDGQFVKDAEQDIINDLKGRDLLFKTQMHEHDYPFCWRCDTPLLYYARRSWFIAMSKLRAELKSNNQKINWVPAHLKKGRFGNWLEEAKDWALSRDRYWGTPLPIWQCSNCGRQEMFVDKNKINKLKDFHRPFIDKVTFECPKCGDKMKRVPYVLDCWFDSGAMPFSSQTQGYPADYICEGIDQTRGWFYTMLAEATALGRQKPPYKNVISLGHVLDKEGDKMSKSKGNAIAPEEIIDDLGVDALRWFFYTVNQPGLPKKLNPEEIQEKQRKVLGTFWNCFKFYKMYVQMEERKRSSKNVLDKWLVSRLNKTIKQVTDSLKQYDVYQASMLIESFIDDLSNWYIRRSRNEFNGQVLGEALLKLSQIMAPFTPFISEEIYQKFSIPDSQFSNSESIHLTDWPKPDKKLIDKKLNQQMKEVREIVRLGLAERAKAEIKVRQPLASLVILSKAKAERRIPSQLQELIKEELNVKKVSFKGGKGDLEVELDTKITPALKKEGEERELIRKIQQLRKKAGLQVGDPIVLYCPEPKKISQDIKKSVWAKQVKQGKLKVEKVTSS